MASTFSDVDYVLFALTLAFSGAVGLFFAWKSRNQQTPAEFLTGSRKMPLIPTAISLLTSFVSGIAYLSYPAEMYTMGTAYVWSLVGVIIALVISGVFVLPVMFEVKSISMYQYIGDRFESRLLHLYSSTVFLLSTLLYLSVVLYAPSIALSGVTGVPLWVFIVSVGLVCNLYTSLGGLKAVVWTDAFQAIIMYGGSITLLVRGILSTGGFSEIFRLCSEGGRLTGFTNIDPDPFQYMTVWTAAFGGTAYWISTFSTNQIAIQRYVSLPSLRQARIVVFCNIPSMALVLIIVWLTGLVMFAYYAYCDPLKAGSLHGNRDQLVIHFVLDVLGDITGLPGLFVACLFSATLSTISSGINSMAAVTYEDFVKPFWKPTRESRATLMTKVLACAFGLLAIAFAFAAKPLGGIFQAVMAGVGSLTGPLVGLILLGVLVPFGNTNGAKLGVLIGTVLGLWVFVGHTILKPDGAYALGTTTCGCENTNVSFRWNASRCDRLPPPEWDHARVESVEWIGLDKFYALSTLMMPLFGALVVLGVGIVASALTGGSDVCRRRPELSYWKAYYTRVAEKTAEISTNL